MCVCVSQKEIISDYYLVRELFWPLELRIYIFRPMRMTDAILAGSPPPGNIKKLCIAPSTSFRFLLASSKTDQSTRERKFSLYPGRFQQQTHGHLNKKEHIQQCSSASFRRPFLTNYFFLLNQMDLETSGWMLNSCSAIYNCFLLPATYSTRVSFCLKLLIKLPN